MSDLAYITYPITSDPDELLSDAVTYIQSKFPAWKGSSGQLDFAILQSWATEAAQLRELASSVPDAIFKIFGTSLIQLPPLDATPATAATTWTMIDTAGYTIPTGALVSIPISGDQDAFFQTVADTIVLPGDSATAAGGVQVVALVDGAASSGLGSIGETVTERGGLTFVSSITQTAATAGGADAEDDGTYFSRLKEQLALMSPRLIVPADFSAAARLNGAYRALAIDGWNPGGGGSSGNPRTVSIACVDSAGSALSSGDKTIIEDYCEAAREVNFEVFVIDPTVHSIDIATTVVALPGYDHTILQATITTALSAFLDSAQWGRDQTVRNVTVARTWVNTPTVRFQDVSSIIRTIEGVDHWSALTTCLHSGTPAQTDIALTGEAPLTSIGTIAVTVT